MSSQARIIWQTGTSCHLPTSKLAALHTCIHAVGFGQKAHIIPLMQAQCWHRIQSLFNSLGDEVKGKTIGLGGDGRYYNKEAAQIIIKMAAANGVKKVPCCLLTCGGKKTWQLVLCCLYCVYMKVWTVCLLLRYWLARMLSWPHQQCLLSSGAASCMVSTNNPMPASYAYRGCTAALRHVPSQ